MTRFSMWIALAFGAALPALADAPGWRASIGTRVAQGCGAAIAPAGIEALLTAGLRDAGITVSTVYNSQLSVEVDCVPVSADSGAALATHQCLDFAELVQTPSKDGHPVLASTWRKCASATFARARCDAGVRAAVQDQLRELSAALRQRLAASTATPPEPSRRFTIEVSPRGLVLFYSSYIVACLSLIVYWQVRKRAY